MASPSLKSALQLMVQSSSVVYRDYCPYSMAKKCEFEDRDFEMAEIYYMEAIQIRQRFRSAVKGYATLLHQKGKTEEALKVLVKYKSECWTNQRYQNLYFALKAQFDRKSQKAKILKVFPLKQGCGELYVKGMFGNSIRIQSIQIQEERSTRALVAFLEFQSQSAARKTLESFKGWEKHSVFWVSDTGIILGDAHYARSKMAQYRKHHPTFEYRMFLRETTGYVLSIPVDGEGIIVNDDDFSDEEGKELLGSLFDELN